MRIVSTSISAAARILRGSETWVAKERGMYENTSKGRRAGWITGTAGLVATLSLLMILPPALGSGAQPARVVSITPPFHGTASFQNLWGVTPCGKAKISTPAFFDFKTGVGGFSGSTSTKSCKGGTSSGAVVDQQGAVEIPIAWHWAPYIFVNGTYAVAANLAFSPGNCTLVPSPNPAYCDRSASVSWSVDISLNDLTSGQGIGFGVVSFSNATYNNTYCRTSTSCGNATSGTSGSFSALNSFAVSYGPFPRMNRTHVYVLQIQAYGTVSTSCDAYGYVLVGCSASASMNFATVGNGFTVRSIVIT